MAKPNNIAKTQFNKLTALEPTKHPYWKFRCECGAIKIINRYDVTRKTGSITYSCGCYRINRARIAHTTHGLSGSRVFSIWRSMKKRCSPGHAAYSRYGGRGISVCGYWLKFENFFSDMGHPPSKNHSIDRINNDLGYFKENCRWVTWTQQQRNRRNNRLITHNGQTLSVSEWAEKLGVKRCSTLYRRLDRGLPFDGIFRGD